MKKVDIFFPMFIGDYMADTGHLTTRQHGAYHLLMYHYWRTRKPLSTDVERLLNICSLSVEEWNIDGPVLLEFFEKRKDGYFHHRIEEELVKALARRDQKVNAGKASGEKRRIEKGSTDVQTDVATDVQTDDSTKCQRNVNASPSPSSSQSTKILKTTQSPKKSAKPSEPFELPSDIPSFEWESWMEVRKKKGATNTNHAKKLLIDKLRSISEKKGMSIKNILELAIMRDWRGIEEGWIKSEDSIPEGKPYRCPDYEKADKVCYHDPENGKPDPRVTHPLFKDRPRRDWGDGRDMTTGHPKLVF